MFTSRKFVLNNLLEFHILQPNIKIPPRHPAPARAPAKCFQQVMLPLLDWNDWTPDRRYWTYPAVVRAFPRCLFESDPRMPQLERSRMSGTETSDCAAAGGGEVQDERKEKDEDDSTSSVVLAQQEQKHQELPPLEKRLVRSLEAPPPLPSETLAQPSVSPFELRWMGEAWIRTAANSLLAPAGVGTGPWRRRWLVLRQNYLFEFHHPPPSLARTTISVPSGERPTGVHIEGGDGRGEGGVRVRDAEGEEREEVFPRPDGFLCLSKAIVEEGGSALCESRTLLLR